MAPRRPLVAVIGGGISGLAAAWELARDGDARVVLIEASPRLGGAIGSRTFDGVRVEQGPDAILASPEVDALVDEMGLRSEVIRPSVFGGLVVTDRGLKRLPPSTALGVPLKPSAAVRTGILSPIGGLRCWSEHLMGTRLSGPDVAVGPFVRERFGPEVLDRMVDPLLAGSRAGVPGRMSLAAAAPQIDKAARSGRSALRGLKRTRPEPATFVSFSGGLEMLVKRFADLIGDKNIRTGARVSRIVKTSKGFEVESLGLQVDGVVVALPAYAAARSLKPLAGSLARIEHASFAIATLVYDGQDSAFPGPGSGVLVPSSEGRMLSACTFYTRKWGSSTSQRLTVVRAVAGRAGDPAWLKAPSDQIALTLEHDVRMLTGHDLALRKHGLKTLRKSLPQYEVGHLDLISEVREELPKGIALAGSYIRGTGIPDCIDSGREAARNLLEEMS